MQNSQRGVCSAVRDSAVARAGLGFGMPRIRARGCQHTAGVIRGLGNNGRVHVAFGSAEQCWACCRCSVQWQGMASLWTFLNCDLASTIFLFKSVSQRSSPHPSPSVKVGV